MIPEELIRFQGRLVLCDGSLVSRNRNYMEEIICFVPFCFMVQRCCRSAQAV